MGARRRPADRVPSQSSASALRPASGPDGSRIVTLANCASASVIRSEIWKSFHSIGYWDLRNLRPRALPAHSNLGLELQYVENGNTTFVADGTAHALKANSLLISRPLQSHRLGDPHVGAGRGYWINLNIGKPDPRAVWQWPPWLLLSPAERAELATRLRRSRPVRLASPDLAAAFVAIGELLAQPAAVPTFNARLMARINDVLIGLLELLRMRQEPPPSLPMASMLAVETCLAHVATHLDEDWHLDAMARRANLKRSRFAHYCQKLTNMSPNTYLKHLRVAAAKRKLRETSQSILSIAMECGFSSNQYFSAVFRGITGATPREFRASTRRA